MDPVTLLYVVIGMLVIYTIAMIPLQYHYFVSLDKKVKKAGSQEKAYDNMSFGELTAHFHTQLSVLNLIPNLVAYLIFKHKNKKS